MDWSLAQGSEKNIAIVVSYPAGIGNQERLRLAWPCSSCRLSDVKIGGPCEAKLKESPRRAEYGFGE